MTRPTDRAGARWYVYVVRCADDSLYCGISPDVAARMAAHEVGQGARYLRGRGPLKLCAQTPAGDRASASRAEYAFKQLSKRDKENVLGAGSGLARFVRTYWVDSDGSRSLVSEA
ncbi:MAG: GIY-YIG nuclease family protein [Pseudomonadota bacterium]